MGLELKAQFLYNLGIGVNYYQSNIGGLTLASP